MRLTALLLAAAEPEEDFRCWWGSGSFEEGCGPARPLPCDELPPVAAPSSPAPLSAAPGEEPYLRPVLSPRALPRAMLLGLASQNE